MSVCVPERVCTSSRVHTALYFIRVDSKFMLPAPSATGELLEKNVKGKGRGISGAVQTYGRGCSFLLGMLMQER